MLWTIIVYSEYFSMYIYIAVVNNSPRPYIARKVSVVFITMEKAGLQRSLVLCFKLSSTAAYGYYGIVMSAA